MFSWGRRLMLRALPRRQEQTNLKTPSQKILGHAARKCKACSAPELGASARCYTSAEMYARKLTAEMAIGAERRPVPLDWLDSFCMRNFTGSAEFDDTLPTGDGHLEAGLRIDPARLAVAMSEWFTKRGKGNGAAVTVEIREEK